MSGVALTASGRPLRFIGVVMALWISGRILVHYPFASDATELATPQTQPPLQVRKSAPFALKLQAKWPVASILPSRRPATLFLARGETNEGGDQVSTPPSPAAAFLPAPVATSPETYAPRDIAPSPPVTTASPGSWQVAAWIFWRGTGGGNALASQGRLGGSQAGLRIDRRLLATPLGTLAGYARASAALEQPHAGEVALGAVLHPALAFPLSIGVERRIAVQSGGRDAFATIITTGIGPREIIPHWSLEGYAQGGVVGLRSRDGFADGRIAITRSLPHTPIAVGVSMSGGLQPQIARLDVGPAAQIRLPTPASARVIIEWRERIAGHARPGSGPSLTVAADF